MRIDSHQHFWRYDPRHYPWIDDSMGVLKEDFGPADLEPLIDACGIDGTIAVQARHSVEETHALLRLAAEHPSVLGVVGWLDLCSPELESALAALAENRWLCGIRHQVQDEPDDRFLLRDDFCRGVERVGQAGLVYDILVLPRQLSVVPRFLAAFPASTFRARPCREAASERAGS